MVEDEEDMAVPLVHSLEREGYIVTWVECGRDALEYLGRHPAELVVLDLGLPDIDGLEVCRRARSGGYDGALIIVTGRSAELDRVVGLDHGADDYLVKPFALGELTARVRALLRRDTGGSAVLRWDDIELDAARHVARIGDRELDLTPKEFALLRFLLLHPDEVHSAERLLEHVWDEHADPFTNTVRVTISNLRRKLVALRVETRRSANRRLIPVEALDLLREARRGD